MLNEKELPNVRTSDGHHIKWDRTNIVNQILSDTKMCEKYYNYPPCDEKLANKVARMVETRILKLDMPYLRGPMVREMVCQIFSEKGMREYHNTCSRVGVPLSDANDIDLGTGYGAKDNANLVENPETGHKRKADKLSKEQTLLMLPPYIMDSHVKGDIHIHDLEYFESRYFCQDFDLRYLFYYGFMPDGKGTNASVSKPAKNPEVAVHHAVNFLGAAQTNQAGGTGYYNFLTFLAPYFKNEDYEVYTQCMQMLVYEFTQMLVARGGQTIFSSLQLSPGVPKLWRDKPVVYRGKVWNGENGTDLRVYGDYEKEVRLLFQALMQVMLPGDATGKPFSFPKPEIAIEKCFTEYRDYVEEFDKANPDVPTYKDLYTLSFELASKFGTPYYDNMIPAHRSSETQISCMQCLTHDTKLLVKTDSGFILKQISELKETDILYNDVGDGVINNGIIERDIDGITKILRISTKKNGEYRCTEDHSVYCSKDGVTWDFKPAIEVEIEDKVAILSSLPETESLDVLSIRAKVHNYLNKNEPQIPQLLCLNKCDKYTFLRELIIYGDSCLLMNDKEEMYTSLKSSNGDKIHILKLMINSLGMETELIKRNIILNPLTTHKILKNAIYSFDESYMSKQLTDEIEFIYEEYDPNIKVYDPVEVTENRFTLSNGLITGNCCAFQMKTSMDSDGFDDKMNFVDGKHFSMGSCQVITTNSPRIAYKAKDYAEFIKLYKKTIDIATEVFKIKRARLEELIEHDRLPFATMCPPDPNTGNAGDMCVYLDELVYTIGVVGINEVVNKLTGHQLHESKEAQKMALRIVIDLNKYAEEVSEKEGFEVVVARTPAETTAQRFAVADLLNDEFSEMARKYVCGDIEEFDRLRSTTRDLPVYYTNGLHVAANADLTLQERIQIENPFFALSAGGNILDIWLGESRPDPRGLYDFAMNIAKNTQIGYFTFTKDITRTIDVFSKYCPKE